MSCRPPPNSDHLSITTTILWSHLELLLHKWTLNNEHLPTTATICGAWGWSLYQGLMYLIFFNKNVAVAVACASIYFSRTYYLQKSTAPKFIIFLKKSLKIYLWTSMNEGYCYSFYCPSCKNSTEFTKRNWVTVKLMNIL